MNTGSLTLLCLASALALSFVTWVCRCLWARRKFNSLLVFDIYTEHTDPEDGWNDIDIHTRVEINVPVPWDRAPRYLKLLRRSHEIIQSDIKLLIYEMAHIQTKVHKNNIVKDMRAFQEKAKEFLDANLLRRMLSHEGEIIYLKWDSLSVTTHRY